MNDETLADVVLAVFMLMLIGLVLWLVVAFSTDTFGTPDVTLPPLTTELD